MEEQKPKHKRKPLPEPPSIESSDNISHKQRVALENEAALASFNTNTLVPCNFCGRTFLEEKLAIHNKSCQAGKTSKRVGESVGPRKDSQIIATKRNVNSPVAPAAPVVDTTSYSGSFSSNRKKMQESRSSPLVTVQNQELEIRLQKLENMALNIVSEIKSIRQSL